MARTYTDEQRVSALAALELNAGNATKTSRAIGIPKPTLLSWRNAALEAGSTQLLTPLTPEKTDWAAVFAEALQEALTSLRSKIPEMSGRDTAIAVGILADKHLDHRDGRKAGVSVSASAQAGVVIQRNTPRLIDG